MMNKTQSDEETVAAVEAAFGGFWGKQSVLDACRRARYADDCPEDMVKERTSWDELKGMFDDVRMGFQALLDLVAKLSEKGDLADGVPVTVRTAGELAQALRGVDPASKLCLNVTTTVAGNLRKRIRTADRAKGCAVELDSFRWTEGGEERGPVVMISNELDGEMTVGADKTVPANPREARPL